jgi:hypothetical protein
LEGPPLEEAHQQAGRIRATLDEFVGFARVSRLDLGPVDLRSLLDCAAPGFGVEGAGRADAGARQLGEAFAEIAGLLAGRGATKTCT